MSRGCVLITGASRGIGFELAKDFARHGHDLLVAARNVDDLQALKKIVEDAYARKVWLFPIDLALDDAAAKIFAFSQNEGLNIDILVNNAGLGDFGPFASADWAKAKQMIDVNITALSHLTRLFLPAMLAQKYGRILNVASTASFQPGPLMAVYYASKAYVLSFSEALANELAGSGVYVTALCPGPTESGFQAAASLEGSRLFAHGKIPTSAAVAHYGYRACMQGKRVAIHGPLNWLMVHAGRLLPRRLLTYIVRLIQEKR